MSPVLPSCGIMPLEQRSAPIKNTKLLSPLELAHAIRRELEGGDLELSVREFCEGSVARIYLTDPSPTEDEKRHLLRARKLHLRRKPPERGYRGYLQVLNETVTFEDFQGSWMTIGHRDDLLESAQAALKKTLEEKRKHRA